MARELTFALNGKDYSVEPVKIDRKKLYGWSEIHAFDDDGNECILVSTDASGTIIIPRGGIGLGMVSDTGKWVERSRLKTISADGSSAAMMPSSYNAVNSLTRTATAEDLLDCSITAFYHLKDAGDDFIAAIGNDIYTFDYCYRDSFEPSPGFLLTAEIDGTKELFLFTGVPNKFEYIGLNELAVADDSESEDEEDSDDIDFSML
ncbi:MAG: hypothetical protein LBV07_01500 [Syntrophobacterales bacterium]|jgi:hypothetical protein|nr:hypothetical protein [Syntrophobacterales bacterium]